MAWSVVLNHCSDATYTVCHTHPHLTTTGTSGSFSADDHGDFTNFDIFLTVTDSGGLTTTKKVNITPNRVDLNFASNIAGINITVDSGSETVPFTHSVPRKSVHVDLRAVAADHRSEHVLLHWLVRWRRRLSLRRAAASRHRRRRQDADRDLRAAHADSDEHARTNTVTSTPTRTSRTPTPH